MAKKRSNRERTVPPDTQRYPGVTLIGVGAVLVLALLASLSDYQYATADARANRDRLQVGLQQKRLREPDAELPRDCILGYISDLPYGEAADSAIFFGAQYVLAPRLLIRADHPLKPELILGNFSRFVDPSQYAAASHLRVVKAYGPGVVLLRREGR